MHPTFTGTFTDDVGRGGTGRYSTTVVESENACVA
jgi:hypothetical protein